MIEISKIAGIDPTDNTAVEAAFATIEPQPIACCNWEEQFPYTPKVVFRMFHTGDFVLLRFDVRECCTMARVREDNGPVWTDSCVEFFIAVDRSGFYYNFECTPIGRLLIGYRKHREQAVHAPVDIMAEVLRFASLGSEPFDERTGDNRWSVTLAIPPQALFAHRVAQWDGLEAGVNLYKCGDALSCPHFLSWRPIVAPNPDFHKPAFFDRIKFSAQ